MRTPTASDAEVEADDLPNELERLGIETLGRLAGLDRDAVADRFGRLGLRARALARGEDEPLRPRRVREALAVELELPDAASGPQLERALELLVSRLLAHSERRGRAVRSLCLSARLAGGGGWRRELALRRASSSRERLVELLLPQLALLPGPAAVLRLQARALGSAAGEQLSLSSPERGPAPADLGGGAPGASGRRQRGGAARARGGPGVAGAGAAGGAHALPRGARPDRAVMMRPEQAQPAPAGAGQRRSPTAAPLAVGRLRVDSVREEWLVEDGWWTRAPLRRRYFELVLEDGSDAVVFCDPDGRWFRQRD